MLKKLGLQMVLVLIGAFFISVNAQTTTVGTISGNLRDPRGAGVPKTEVTITEERTGVSRTVMTDDNGFYSAPSLAVGIYTVSTSPPGFKKTVANGVDLHVAENRVVNLDLQLGQVSETVTVSGTATPVETRSGDVNSLISEKQVTELPLNGRNYAALVTLVPGLSAPNESGAFGTRGTGLDSHVDVSVNGNQSNANMWTVDGVNNMDVGSNATLLVFPSIDSIAEFKVERNSFSAEYGQAQGAVINLVTKGGGNQFHGTGFYFLRDDSLNANDFFLNKAGQPKGQLKYKNFGGNFSGPIIKNRVFFFWSEEWRREKRGTALTGHVPTLGERAGDFTGPLATNLSGVDKPRDPLTGLPFPGNRIPADRLSPAGLAMMGIFPAPNNASDPLGTNWVAAPLQPVDTRQDLIRGDVTISDKMNLMIRYIHENWTHGVASGNFWGDTPFPTLSSDWDQPSRSFSVKLTNTLTSTSVNEFQFSRAGNDIFISTSASTEALNNAVAAVFPTVFPRVAGTGYPTVGWGAGGIGNLWHQAPWQNHEDLFTWKDDFSKVMGNHDLKFGGLFSHNIKNEQPNGGSGLYTVQQDGSKTGNATAELLLKDLPILDYAEVARQDTTLGRWHDMEFYGNDVWKMRPNVTLTLGMRYSVIPPAYAKDDRITNWIPERYDGHDINTGFVRADQASAAGLPRATVKTYHGGFQPRVGLAWDIKGDGKMALRLGAGRYMSRANVISGLLRLASNPPWNTAVDSGWHPEAVRLSDCPTCRSLDTINPGLRDAAVGLGSGTINSIDPNFRPAESWQWNVTVSREIMRNTVAEVSYVGNHGLHIWRFIDGNYNDVIPSARAAVAAGANGNDFRRFGFINNVRRDESTGDSNYHALQVWIDRRFSNQVAFQVAYTLSRTISNVPTQSYVSATTDVFNYDLDKGYADLDRRHALVFNVVYALPSYKNLGKLGSAILGDWQLNSIASFYSGTPLNILSGVNRAGLIGNSTQRPDRVTGVPLYLHIPGDPLAIVNPAAFSIPALGTFGNLKRGDVRGPGISNIDFSVAKNWKVKERYGIQFRTEMFNVFNHTNFRAQNLSQAGGGIENNFSNPGFGRATSTRGPREIQFGFKFTF
jgi:hypothetical protein